jgi:hypothetical protein
MVFVTVPVMTKGVMLMVGVAIVLVGVTVGVQVTVIVGVMVNWEGFGRRVIAMKPRQ